jgi:hypothetical protein
MTYTGRHTSRKLSSKRAPLMALRSGEQIARSVRVEELRRLMAARRYRVEPYRLAARILARALAEV